MKETIEAQVPRNGKIIAMTRGDGSDFHLSAVLVKFEDGEEVSWWYNHESEGFSNGTYSLARAKHLERSSWLLGLPKVLNLA